MQQNVRVCSEWQVSMWQMTNNAPRRQQLPQTKLEGGLQCLHSLFCSVFHLFALHVAPAASRLQLIKSGTFFQLFESVLAMTLCVINLRPSIFPAGFSVCLAPSFCASDSASADFRACCYMCSANNNKAQSRSKLLNVIQ